MHSLVRFVLLCVSFTLAADPLVAGETVSDQHLGFRLTVPDGFVSLPDKIQGDTVYVFHRPPGADQKVATFIQVSRLGGVLGREKMDTKTLTARFPQGTIVIEKWKEFDVEVVRAPVQAGELPLLAFSAQIPLKPEAVQVTIVGEAAREDDLRGVLGSVLASLDGSTNWLTDAQRDERLGQAVGMTVAVIVAVAVVVWQVVRRRKSVRGRAGPDRPRE